MRSCGILLTDEGILLLKHAGVGPGGFLWSPPGGGVDFGESLEETLKREFLEETGLTVDVESFLFCNEFIGKQHHALEFFFKVNIVAGALKLGTDPELDKDQQLLLEARFFQDKEILSIPRDNLHEIFQFCKTPKDLLTLKGLF